MFWHFYEFVHWFFFFSIYFLQSPQAGTKEKTLCCWFCTSGPISLSAKIERKGYTPGESIQIFAEIENCSSRMVVPKAAIYQTQAFYAKGKMKEVKQLVANLRGESLSSGKTETWDGKLLKIPPVSPSILDCSIIRVEYSLMVYVDIPGAMDLLLSLPLVIGTIPLHPFGSRTSSVSSQCSMNMNWLGLSLPERPEAPPSYAEVVTEEQRRNNLAPVSACDDFERALQGPLFAYIQEFRFLPPPLYSEIDPNPDQSSEDRPSCPSRWRNTWLNQVDVGSELYLFRLRTEKYLGDTFSEEVELALPRQMANTWNNQWSCFRILQHHSGLLQHAWRSELSLKPRAVFLACDHVSRHRCKEGCCPSYLKICTCSMLTLCSSMSLQLFSIYARLLILLKTMWSAQHGTKESFEKLWH